MEVGLGTSVGSDLNTGEPSNGQKNRNFSNQEPGRMSLKPYKVLKYHETCTIESREMANRQRCFGSIGYVYVFVRHNQQNIGKNTKNILKNVTVFCYFFVKYTLIIFEDAGIVLEMFGSPIFLNVSNTVKASFK